MALAASAVVSASPASAQIDPRPILQGVVQQLSTGTPNPAWYGPQLWTTLAMQTGNTGYFPQLAAAGPVTSIVVLQQQQLPQGILFRLRSQHAAGASFDWLLGFGPMSGRVEYLVSNPVAPPVLPPPIPDPQPGRPTPPPSPNPGSTTIPSSGTACQKFPDLCGG